MGCNLKIRRSQEPPGVTSAADTWQPAGNRPLAAWRGVQAVKLWWEGVWAPHNAHAIKFLDDSSLAWHQDRLWTMASFPGAGSKMSWLLVQPDERWGGQVRRRPHPSPAFSRWLFPPPCFQWAQRLGDLSPQRDREDSTPRRVLLCVRATNS